MNMNTLFVAIGDTSVFTVPDGGGGYTCLCNIDTALGECLACYYLCAPTKRVFARGQ